tara:strand:- start:450 stop:767 length:318 start_codon:yes stop_codon:yes gene_type:complete
MIKKFKTILFVILAINFVYSCSTLKEGFKSQRKNSTDEFLVEKKQPLVVPPDFDALPVPNQKKINSDENQLEKLIIEDNDNTQNQEKNKISNQNTENFILKKIKK